MTVNYISYNDQQLPLKVDFKVISKISKKFNYKLSEFGQVMDNTEGIEFAFAEALKRGFELEKKVFDFDEDELNNILSQSLPEFIEAFTTDTFIMFNKKGADVEDAKKKLMEIQQKIAATTEK